MSEYLPPNNLEPISIFNPANFIHTSGFSQAEADKRYLRFPNAQGAENLQAITVNGNSSFNKPITMTGAQNDRVISSTNYAIIDANSNAVSGVIAGISNNLLYDNNVNSGQHIFKNNDSSGVEQVVETIDATGITAYKTLKAITNYGPSANETLSAIDSVSNKILTFLPNSSTGSYNASISAGSQSIIASGGAVDTNVLQLATWSTTTNTVRLTNNSVLIGAGGSTPTPSSSVLCNGSSVVVSPSLTFPDNSVQNSGFTGAKALAGSYTNTNMTIDANGRITALSNGTGASNSVNYTFSGGAVQTITIPANCYKVDFYVIGGGGNAGANNAQPGGGGGGGSVSATTSSIFVSAGQIFTIRFGTKAGGAYFDGQGGGVLIQSAEAGNFTGNIPVNGTTTNYTLCLISAPNANNGAAATTDPFSGTPIPGVGAPAGGIAQVSGKAASWGRIAAPAGFTGNEANPQGSGPTGSKWIAGGYGAGGVAYTLPPKPSDPSGRQLITITYYYLN